MNVENTSEASNITKWQMKLDKLGYLTRTGDKSSIAQRYIRTDQ